MAKVILILLLASPCYGVTIKATGTVRARIIAPEVEVQQTIVYTNEGATAQVVF